MDEPLRGSLWDKEFLVATLSSPIGPKGAFVEKMGLQKLRTPSLAVVRHKSGSLVQRHGGSHITNGSEKRHSLFWCMGVAPRRA